MTLINFIKDLDSENVLLTCRIGKYLYGPKSTLRMCRPVVLYSQATTRSLLYVPYFYP